MIADGSILLNLETTLSPETEAPILPGMTIELYYQILQTRYILKLQSSIT